jgi:hypothetical protein
VRGFYGLEAGAWRWTAQEFEVVLQVPPDVRRKGGFVTLQGTILPEAVRNGPLTIAATLPQGPLAPQSFEKPGEVIYRADVRPENLPPSDRVLVRFTLNRTFRVPGDQRDLGIIASVISLRSK